MLKKSFFPLIPLFILSFLLTVLAPPVAAREIPENIKKLLGKTDALLVTDAKGKTVYAWNKDSPMIPASTLKILTALVALEVLGPSYRFVTEFYTSEKDYLKMKGYGDPLLISEVMDKMAAEIPQKDGDFHRLMLDDTYFSPMIHIPGTGTTDNPYDSPVGALCANFNTVNFKKGKNNKLESAEPQTPLVAFAEKIIKAEKPAQGRVLLTQRQGQATLYAGHLFAWFWEKHQKKPFIDIIRGHVIPSDDLYFRFKSPYTLEEVIRKFLKYSQNFSTNQVLLAMGAHSLGAPATREKGVRVLRDYSRDFLGLDGLGLVEGSGLSGKNRLTTVQMMAILKKFTPWRGLMPWKRNVAYKTGSLSGVRAMSGYVEGKNGRVQYRFVIFSNTHGKSAKKIFNTVLKSLNRPETAGRW